MKTKWLLMGTILVSATATWAASMDAPTKSIRSAVNDQVPTPNTRDELLFSENFEEGMNGWSSVDIYAQTPEWHVSDFEANDGMNWWSGNEELGGYDNHWLHYLVSPVLDLSGATSPMLTFDLNYSVEEPGGEPAGYDGWDACNVWVSTDGGDNWDVMENPTPAYGSSSCYSFGFEFGMGEGIAGWTGNSGGWVEASFDMTDYISSETMFRFAFCSDPAYSTADNGDLYGMIVDNVELADGGTVYLSNDADGTADPADFTPAAGGDAPGDYWELTDSEYHSPTTSAHCPDGYFGLGDALVSPVITLPEGYTIYFQYWIHCDLPDADGDGDNSLEDYYQVEVSTDGLTWTRLYYDYNRDESGGAGWVLYGPGIPFNGNVEMDLSDYGGMDIQLRFVVQTDDNNDAAGSPGTGMFIDDIEIWGTDMPPHDFSTTKLVVPYPRSAGWTTPIYAEFTNTGSNDETNVNAFVWADGANLGPVLPPLNLESGAMASRTKDWTPSAPGVADVWAFTMLMGDSDMSNDTAYVNDVQVLPEGSLEFAYYYGELAWFFHSDVNSGYGMHATLSDDGLDAPFSINEVHALFYNNFTGTSQVNVAIYEDDGGVPGAELYSDTYDVPLAAVYPNTTVFEVPNVEVTGGCFVWLQTLTDGGDGHSRPEILGADFVHNENHYFNWDGAGALDYSINNGEDDSFELFISIVGEDMESVTDVAAPSTFALEQNYPNPFNPNTEIRFSTQQPQQVTLNVYNVLGERVATLFDGVSSGAVQSINFDASNYSSGVYMYQLADEQGNTLTRKMLLTK